MSFDVYTSLLKMFDEFHEDSKDIHLSYDLTNQELQKINEKYKLNDIAGKGDSFSKTINILFWLSKNCYHNGNFNFEKEINAKNVLEYSYQKGEEYGVNCLALATTLTECLLSINLIARTISIMPFAPYDYDNHVITHVYIKELKKWIMVDPTYRCYIMDKEKTPLNVFETRELLSNQDYVVFNKEIKHNDEKIEEDSHEIKEYYAKDLFYFMTPEISCHNERIKNRRIYIVPSFYDIKKSEILNVEYRIKNEGETEWLKNRQKNIKERNYLYLVPSEIIKQP